MIDPLIWLGLSTLMLAAGLAVFLAVLIPTIQELNRVSRSAEKLLDTLNRELPMTLDALRSTGRDLADITEDLGEGIESAKQIVKQVDRSLDATEKQITQASLISRSAIKGIQVGWQTFFQGRHHQPVQPSQQPVVPSSQADIQQAITDEVSSIDSSIDKELSERS